MSTATQSHRYVGKGSVAGQGCSLCSVVCCKGYASTRPPTNAYV
jgi:hypothetical protein